MDTTSHTLTEFADVTFDAVLFDMDGTLIDSVPAVNRNWRRWAREYGLDADSFEVSHGVPARLILRELLPAEDVEAAYRRIHDLEVLDTEGVVLLPGVREALAATTGRYAVVTSCTRVLAAARTRSASLVPEVLVTADDVTHGKPAPDPFLLGAELLGVDPARCLAVEDAPAGVASARAAGCTVLAVTGTHTRQQLAGADPAPDAVADGLAAVRFEQVPAGIRLR